MIALTDMAPKKVQFTQTTEGITVVIARTDMAPLEKRNKNNLLRQRRDSRIAVTDMAPKIYNLLGQRRELIQWLHCTD